MLGLMHNLAESRVDQSSLCSQVWPSREKRTDRKTGKTICGRTAISSTYPGFGRNGQPKTTINNADQPESYMLFSTTQEVARNE